MLTSISVKFNKLQKLEDAAVEQMLTVTDCCCWLLNTSPLLLFHTFILSQFDTFCIILNLVQSSTFHNSMILQADNLKIRQNAPSTSKRLLNISEAVFKGFTSYACSQLPEVYGTDVVFCRLLDNWMFEEQASSDRDSSPQYKVFPLVVCSGFTIF